MEFWLEGTVLVACNCDPGCPCNFSHPPSKGYCEGGWSWHVENGRVSDVDLSGLAFSLYCAWPGAIHEGGGRAVAFVDERADDSQRETVASLARGEVGGPWEILSATWDSLDGPHPARYEVELDDVRSRLRVGNAVEVELEPIRNPVTQAETFPRLVLPQGFVFKDGAVAVSRIFRLADGVAYDHSGKYAAVAPFAYGSG